MRGRPTDQLTKADTVALWHAVDTMAYCVRAMPTIEGITSDQIEAEKAKLAAARRALRKVNRLRQTMGRRSTIKAQVEHQAAGGAEA
ncbi:MAG: hypothetical protein ACN6O3_10000 [Comamonas sp.]